MRMKYMRTMMRLKRFVMIDDMLKADKILHSLHESEHVKKSLILLLRTNDK